MKTSFRGWVIAYINTAKDKIYNPSQSAEVGVGGIQKNTGAGDQASAQGPSSTKSPANFTQSQNLQGASTAVINRNKDAGESVGRALQQPGQKQLQGTLFGLGNEQSAFKQAGEKQIADNMPAYNSADLANAGSDANAMYRVQDAYNKQYSPVADYKTSLNTTINNPTLTGNYANILQQQKGPTYSKGMGLLDQTLFSRAPGRAGDLASQYVGMQNQVNQKVGEGADITKSLNAQGQSSLDALKNNIRGDVAKQQQAVLSAAGERVPGAINQQIEDRYKDLQKVAAAHGNTLDAPNHAAAVAAFENANPEYARDQMTQANQYSQGDVSELNALQQILGLSPSYSYSPAANLKQVNLNDQQYNNLLTGALNPYLKAGVSERVEQPKVVTNPSSIEKNTQNTANQISDYTKELLAALGAPKPKGA